MPRVALLDLASGTNRQADLHWPPELGPLSIALARKFAAAHPDPFLVIGRGLLSGLPVVGAQVATVTGLSPVAGGVVEAKVEGSLAQWLHRAGLDVLVLSGSSATAVTAELSGQGQSWALSISDASPVAHHGVFATDKALRHHVDDIIITTGPWGMNGHPAASVVTNCGFPTAQGGLGAVLGALGLKALVLRSDAPTPSASPLQQRITEEYAAGIDSNPLAASERDYPGFGLWPSEQALGYAGSGGFSGQPTRGLMSFDADALMRYAADSGAQACPGCPQSCLKSFVTGPEVPVDGGRVHQLGIAALASQSGETNPATLVEFNALCHDWGVEHLAAEESLRQMGRGDDPLETRLRQALEAYPLGAGVAERVKGMAIPPFEPRANQGLAVGYALNPTGPRYDVLEHDIDFDPEGVGEERSTVGRDWGVPEGGLPMGTLDSRRHASIVSLWLLWSGLDALGLCEYAAPPTRELGLQDVLNLASEQVGRAVGREELEDWGRIRLGLLRDLNNRLGVSDADDRLPERFFAEPLPSGRLAGTMIDEREFARALDYVRNELHWTTHGVDDGLVQRVAESDRMLDEQLGKQLDGAGV